MIGGDPVLAWLPVWSGVQMIAYCLPH